MNLTIDDFKNMMFTLASKTYESRPWVVMTGQRGMFIFNLLMRGISLNGINIKYYLTQFERCKNLLQLDLIQKHGLYKIIVKINEKTFEPRIGTKSLGTYNTVEEAIAKLKL